MKILFCGYHNPHFITITEYIERAIEKLGHTLIAFDDREFIFPGRLRDEFNFLQKFDSNRLNKRLLETVHESMPDLLFVTGGHRVLPDTVKECKKQGIKTALWTIDAPGDFSPIIKASPYYDYVFCGGTEAITLLEKANIKNARWLPFACDSQIHRTVEITPEEKNKYGADIAFVGSFYPNREKVLEQLVETKPKSRSGGIDFDLGIWGPGWEKLPKKSPLKNCIRGNQLKPDEWIKIFCSAKIVIVIHYKDLEGKILCYQASPKVYEALACKTFVITDAQKDVLSIFKPGKHLVSFKTIKELKELIKYYLQAPEEREKIARQGYEEVITKHTYAHRINEMLKIIGTNKGQSDKK
jgi:spore maturation protein CgeB